MTDEFNPPKKGSKCDKIAEFLADMGPMHFRSIVELMRARNMEQYEVASALGHMRENGWLELNDKKYSLSFVMMRLYRPDAPISARYCGEIVQPREVPEFRPIQPKNQFWNNPRFERRDICFKSIGNPSPYYGTN